MNANPPDAAPQGTRLALIEAGLHLFGRQSFAATSTRELAAHAQTNIGSIAYHFGGKEGLRLACVEEFVRRVRAVAASVPDAPDLEPKAARAQLKAMLRAMVAFFLSGPQAETVQFVLREITEGGAALDVLYRGLAEPTHRRLCALWGATTGAEPESEAVRLSVFSFIGQVLYFRIGGAIVSRRMGWAEIGPDEAARISVTLLANLDALLATSGGA